MMVDLKKRIVIALILNLSLFSASVFAFVNNWEVSNTNHLIASAFAVFIFMTLIVFILIKNHKILFAKNN